MFLAKTVENLLENTNEGTEIIAVLDGQWATPELKQHPRLKVLYYPENTGQRAATNRAVRLSKAKYIMKLDAHVAVDKDFDKKMMAEMKDDWTLIPTMYNLHAFDWICDKCGRNWYQGPTPTHCKEDYKGKIDSKCDGKKFHREIHWHPRKGGPKSIYYRFDNTLHFQDYREFKNRKEAKGDIAPTMSIQGSCFMLTRDKFWELNICDEKHTSWGQQGTEVACATWLSGGKVMVNKKTWYAHMFRTQGQDFGFPYPNPGSQVKKAREYSRYLWFGSNHKKQIYSLKWLLKKFWPVPGWTEKDLEKIGDLK